MRIPSWLLLFSYILQSHSNPPTKYLVKDKHCKILDTKAEDSPVTKLFKPLPLTRCSSSPPLSTIVYNKDASTAALKIFPHRFSYFNLTNDSTCLYQKLSLSKDGLLSFVRNYPLSTSSPSLSHSTPLPAISNTLH